MSDNDSNSLREESESLSFMILSILLGFVGILLLSKIFYIHRKQTKYHSHSTMKMLMAYLISLFIKTLFGILIWNCLEMAEYFGSQTDDDKSWLMYMPYKTVCVIISASTTLAMMIWLLLLSYETMTSVNSFKGKSKTYFLGALVLPILYLIFGLAIILPKALRNPLEDDELLVKYQLVLFFSSFIASVCILGFIFNALKNLNYHNPQSKHAKSLKKTLSFLIYYPIVWICTEIPVLIALCFSWRYSNSKTYYFILQACYTLVATQGVISAFIYIRRSPLMNKIGRTKSGRIKQGFSASKESTLQQTLLDDSHDNNEGGELTSTYDTNFLQNVKDVFLSEQSLPLEESGSAPDSLVMDKQDLEIEHLQL